MTPPVLLEIEGGVATVTLNRPQVRNAISGELLDLLRKTMIDLGGRDDVAAVVLTGADPAFCAGLDLKELSAGGGRLAVEDADPETPPNSPWRPLGKPLIGAVNGVAVTGGLEFALNCDFLVASERAAFADTHARVGILPGSGLSVLLPQRVGFAMARRMSFTGDYLRAEQARQAGLVTEVVAHEDLLATAQRIAATIAGNNQAALSALHASYRRIEAEVTAAGLADEIDASRAWTKSGAMAGLADRVPGVISRGREQTAN